MACEVTLGSLRYSFAAPTDEDKFRQGGIRVFDFDEGKLDSAVGELIYKVNKFTFCIIC